MTATEFQTTYNLPKERIEEYLNVFDDLYCRFTPYQAIQILVDYLNNADEIFNSRNSTDQEKFIDNK